MADRMTMEDRSDRMADVERSRVERERQRRDDKEDVTAKIQEGPTGRRRGKKKS